MSDVKVEEITQSEIENILKALNSVNSAEQLAEIIEIPGKPDVGLKIANSILEYRAENGIFRNLMQVKEVPLIGPKRLDYILESLKGYSPPFELQQDDITTMKFRSSAMAPVLNYEIPSPSSYEGRNYIQVNLDKNKFTFNSNANKHMSIDEYLELNKSYISEYINIATKEELERQLYLVFDFDANISESAVELYQGTYTFEDGTLEGWLSKIYGKSIAEVQSFKAGHNKVAYINPDKGYQIIGNNFGRKESGTIQFWIYLTNLSKFKWCNQVAFFSHGRSVGHCTGAFFVMDYNLYWWTGKSSNQRVLILKNTVNKWIHITLSWIKSKVEIQILGNPKITSTISFPPEENLIADHFGSMMFKAFSHQQMWLDAIGYSWDPNYNIGDNLGKTRRAVSKEAIDPAVITALDNLDELSLKEKYNIFKALIKAAITSYNRIPVFSRSMGGSLNLRWIKLQDLKPQLFLIETYKLSNFPGDYGPGRLIKTYSLFPGEETEISVKTWKKSTSTVKEASSILDSYTTEKADEFESSVQKESSQTSKIEQTDTLSVNASIKSSWGASAGIGFAKARGKTEIEAGVQYDKNVKSTREVFAKNVLNSTSKHAQKASSKREIEIETSYERTEETGEEIAIIRKIENLNVSRTLNFVFRQMNQQHHSILHLTDLKVAFFNGFPGSMKEFELSELIDLVNEYTSNPVNAFNYLYDLILGEYGEGKMSDYLGNKKTFIKEIIVPENATSEDEILYKYLRVVSPDEEEGEAEYVIREETAQHPKDTRTVNGIIIGSNVVTMRTDGVIIEALLGEANALDGFTLEARREKIKDVIYENNMKLANIEKLGLGIEIIKQYIEQKQLDKAVEAYKEIFGMRESLKTISEILGTQSLELKKKLIDAK